MCGRKPGDGSDLRPPIGNWQQRRRR